MSVENSRVGADLLTKAERTALATEIGGLDVTRLGIRIEAERPVGGGVESHERLQPCLISAELEIVKNIIDDSFSNLVNNVNTRSNKVDSIDEKVAASKRAVSMTDAKIDMGMVNSTAAIRLYVLIRSGR